MKLYTEEQIRNAIADAWDNSFKVDATKILNQLTPIELPSDEEIEKECNKLPFEKHVDCGMYNDAQIDGFELGAKWIKEQILNQNKELLILDFDKVKEEWIKEANGMTELEKVKYYFKKINDNQNK